MKAVILLSTRNRASDLRKTLESLRQVQIPDSLDCELLVVDNGSTDETQQVVLDFDAPQLPARCTVEPIPGVARARNRGLAETTGELIFCIDDDIRLSPDWLLRMAAALLRHQPCAVAGGVVLAPHLCRPWMTRMHRSWLAATEWLDREKPLGLVGANMAFWRSLLDIVPGFDSELGPGASGFGEEQLFARQLLEAGIEITGAHDVCVEHHFSPQRLERNSWLDAALKRAKSHAYTGHHWEHWSSRLVRPRLARAILELNLWALRHRRDGAVSEGCSEKELLLRYRCALLRAHLAESRRPRNYSVRGLLKRTPANNIPGFCSTTPASCSVV